MSRRSQSLPMTQYDGIPSTRGKCVSCLCFSWKIFTCVFSHVTLVTLVVAYCILGAFTFERLESENEVMVSFIFARNFYVFQFEFRKPQLNQRIWIN